MPKVLNYFNSDREDLSILFNNINFDMVIHCATNYGNHNKGSLDIIDSNLLLPLKLLELSIESGVKVFINTDTMLPKMVSDYSMSKEHFLDWLRSKSEKIVALNIPIEHFYGPNDDPSKFVSFLINSFQTGVKEIPLTAGEQERDFIYIDDVINAFNYIFKHSAELSNGFYEFQVGTGKSISIQSFVRLVQELSGNSHTKLLFGALSYRPNELMSVAVNIDPLLALGWTPKYSLLDGLRKSILWETYGS